LVNLKKLISICIVESWRDSTPELSVHLGERILALEELEDDVEDWSRQRFKLQIDKEPMVRTLYNGKLKLFG